MKWNSIVMISLLSIVTGSFLIAKDESGQDIGGLVTIVSKPLVNNDILSHNNDDEKENSSSQITQLIDEIVDLNQKYIIPLSYGYICYDVFKNIGSMIYVESCINKGEIIFPTHGDNNPYHQKIVSKVIEVAQKIGKMPWSIVIVDDLPEWWACADGKDLVISRLFFEKNSESEIEYVLAHELSHIKNHHSSILNNVLIGLSGIFSVTQLKFDENDVKDNFKKIFRMLYTSPLLYYFGAKIIWYALCRSCEKQADLEAAAAIGPEGGIKFFEKLLNSLRTGLFDSHPSDLDRITYLQNMKY